MKSGGESRFSWWYAFFGSLFVVFGALVVIVKDGPLATGCRIAALACAVAFPVLQIVERRRDIEAWLARNRSTILALGVATIFLIGGVAAGFGLSPRDKTSPAEGSPQYATRVNTVLHRLFVLRATAYTQLEGAHRSDTQAAIATELQRGFERGARTIRKTRPPADDRKANHHIARELETAGASYVSLRGAAVDRSGSQMELDHARHHVRRVSRRLWAAQRALAGNRYRVVAPRE